MTRRANQPFTAEALARAISRGIVADRPAAEYGDAITNLAELFADLSHSAAMHAESCPFSADAKRFNDASALLNQVAGELEAWIPVTRAAGQASQA